MIAELAPESIAALDSIAAPELIAALELILVFELIAAPGESHGRCDGGRATTEAAGPRCADSALVLRPCLPPSVLPHGHLSSAT